MVEFVLVSAVAVVLTMAARAAWVVPLGAERADGVAVGRGEGRGDRGSHGRRRAARGLELLRRSAGARVADAVLIHGTDTAGVVVLRAEGTLPSFVPGVPSLPVRMTARMHGRRAL